MSMSLNRKPKGSAKDAKGKGTGGQFASKPVASQPSIDLIVEDNPSHMSKPFTGSEHAQVIEELKGKGYIYQHARLALTDKKKEIRTRYLDVYRTDNLKWIVTPSLIRSYSADQVFGMGDEFQQRFTLGMMNATKDQMRIFGGLDATEENYQIIKGQIEEYWKHKIEEVRHEPTITDTAREHRNIAIQNIAIMREKGTHIYQKILEIENMADLFWAKIQHKDRFFTTPNNGKGDVTKLLNFKDDIYPLSVDDKKSYMPPGRAYAAIDHMCGRLIGEKLYGGLGDDKWARSIICWARDYATLNPSVDYAEAISLHRNDVPELFYPKCAEDSWQQTHFLSSDAYCNSMYHGTSFGVALLEHLQNTAIKHYDTVIKPLLCSP